jgi:hypothetical protein
MSTSKKKRGLGPPTPPPRLPPLDTPAPALGGLLSEDLDDWLFGLSDLLGHAFDSAETHPDPGKAPILRQKIRRTRDAIALLIRRLQGELAHIN